MAHLTIELYLLNLQELFFFFNDTATTEIYTLSLHDALPISSSSSPRRRAPWVDRVRPTTPPPTSSSDRKSTRLNSSHTVISYAVFCLKKKKKLRQPLSFNLYFDNSCNTRLYCGHRVAFSILI